MKAAAAGESWGHYHIAECHLRGRVANPSLATAEESLRAFETQWFRDHPPLDSPFRVGRERSPADDLYAQLETALGRTVERSARKTGSSSPQRRAH